ncbi:MAG: TIR domain-containing protein [Opitutaceae bacterium]|nr:TIR domain-containing protein [Opitutaceae bacterium]
MNDSGKAVFLSYASQDAAAARKICEALRAAGVEVWFDQSELRGGDSWDQKIRRQIKECALFVPVISANTNARAEGYFRREWNQAVERTRDMAEEKLFLVPVVIDGTTDANALVPEKFRTVQWTRLSGAEDNAAFAERLVALLGPAAEASFHARVVGEAEARRSSRISRGRTWSLVAIVVVLASAAFGWRWQRLEEKRPPPAAPRRDSPAAESVAKAQQTLAASPEPGLFELKTAEEFCRRAVEQDGMNAEAWAAWSQVETWFVAQHFDISVQRREGARTKAARAVDLAPTSFEARLAHACFLVRGEGFVSVSALSAEAEPLLQKLLEERPDEPRALLALGHFMRARERYQESLAAFDRMALNANPVLQAAAHNARGWLFRDQGKSNEALAAAERSVALRPYYGNTALLISLALNWRGDLDLAKSTLARMSARDLMEDFGASIALEVCYYRREPAGMLSVLRAVPRPWLDSNRWSGPKDYWTGLAHQMAGNGEAATLAWRDALKQVQQRLEADAGQWNLHFRRGELLLLLEERPEAEKAFALAKQLGSTRATNALLATPAVAIAGLRNVPWAVLRYYPRYDRLRSEPAFQQLLLAAEKDPRRSPHAAAAAKSEVVK